AALAESLGIETLVLLDASLPGDHTDGHIDNSVRFVAEDRVLAIEPFAEAARAALAPLGIAVDALPMAEPWDYTFPPHVPDPGTHPLPASYANFLITNGRVILPAYGQPTDADATSVVQKAFPDREVVTLPARHILIGGGSFHCLTMQLPAGSTIRA
ncbi:MAG: agmatine deiminase family protein, partial [Planctomycetota bacterium]